MKFRHKVVKLDEEKTRATHGDYRTITKFAWTPVKISPVLTVWLEKYHVIEKYIGKKLAMGRTVGGYWTEVKKDHI